MAKANTAPEGQTTTPTPAEAMEDEWFDLLPIELKLIRYSLILGVGLLIVFFIVFRVLPKL